MKIWKDNYFLMKSSTAQGWVSKRVNRGSVVPNIKVYLWQNAFLMQVLNLKNKIFNRTYFNDRLKILTKKYLTNV